MSVLAVFGPTASGKTAVAEAVADRIPAEIVSADSMQVYRGLPVLTNQPDRPTHLVGVWELDHEASVGEYEELAHAAIDEVLELAKTPIVVGGTGLYLRAALAELDLPPAPAPGERNRWEAFYDAEGAESAHALLADRDPEAAAGVHPNDRRRVVRALELAAAGRSLAPEQDRLWTAPHAAPDADLRLRAATGGARAAHRRAYRRDVRGRRPGRGAAGACSSDLADGPAGDGARGGRNPPRGRGERTARAADSSLRRVPAKVDAAHTRPC